MPNKRPPSRPCRSPRPSVFGASGAVLAGAMLLSACSIGGETSAEPDEGEEPLSVYATTGYLADAVANIAPEAEVTTMVGPGGDPHTYQPSTQDIQIIQSADAVLWNGLLISRPI